MYLGYGDPFQKSHSAVDCSLERQIMISSANKKVCHHRYFHYSFVRTHISFLNLSNELVEGLDGGGGVMSQRSSFKRK